MLAVVLLIAVICASGGAIDVTGDHGWDNQPDPIRPFYRAFHIRLLLTDDCGAHETLDNTSNGAIIIKVSCLSVVVSQN